ncbi:MAG: Ig-like domain-containing protein [Balneolaceae bacterium]|nr:Ig-like domain-containing protein [Balneolaceae bacterium]
MKPFLSSIYLAVSLLLVFPLSNHAQELTSTEFERFVQIRDSLIQEGFLQDNRLAHATLNNNEGSIIDGSSYSFKRRSVRTDNSRASDFSPDGTRFYVLGRLSLNIAEYELTDPWDISTANYVRELDISGEMGTAVQEDPVPNGMFIRKSDGLMLWVINRTEIWEYTLSTPWDISSATQTGYRDLSNLLIRGHDIDFKPDGRVLYVDDRFFEAVFQFDLSDEWDISTLSLDYIFDISDQQEEVRGIQLNMEGSRMYLMDTIRQEILEYTISESYNLRSASFIGSYDVSDQAFEPRGLTFTPDLSMFYVTEAIENRVYQYVMPDVDPNLSDITADLSVIEADNDSFSTLTVKVQSEDGVLYPGLKVQVTGDQDSQIEAVQSITNNAGEAIFRVKNTQPKAVTYTAAVERITGNISLNEIETIRFLPLAPLTLNPTEVETNSFVANWELVTGATSYIIDVSEDDEFSRLLVEDEDIGFTTNYGVTGLDPGEAYYYRVRASTDSLISKNSETVEVITFPETPVVITPGNINVTRFTAQWSSAQGAREYILDVASDESFSQMVPGYENLNVGNNLSYDVSGLNPGSDYYYRVKAKSMNRESPFSESMNIRTLQISPEHSQISTSQIRAIANGNQEILVDVFVRDTDGKPVIGEEIQLKQDPNNSLIESIQSVTDENGLVRFILTSEVTGKVNYSAAIAETFEIGSFSIEYLPVDGELFLGDNYPNPFNGQTTIPVNVPESMHITIQIANALGSHVLTIISDVLETGYYEIEADLSGLASGVYFYRLFADDTVKTKKMIFVK